MIRIFTVLTLAVSGLSLLPARPGEAAELRLGAAHHGRGTCYADGREGCRPLRAANRVNVIYGPAVVLHPPVEPVYVVDQGPQLARAPLETDYGIARFPVGFVYGGARVVHGSARPFYRHERGPHGVHPGAAANLHPRPAHAAPHRAAIVRGGVLPHAGGRVHSAPRGMPGGRAHGPMGAGFGAPGMRPH